MQAVMYEGILNNLSVIRMLGSVTCPFFPFVKGSAVNLYLTTLQASTACYGDILFFVFHLSLLVTSIVFMCQGWDKWTEKYGKGVVMA
jgi:hypothetical protein